MSERERPWEPQGPYRQRRGPAWDPEAPRSPPCNKKLCFVATDEGFLVGLLSELSDRPDCWGVKYSVEPRDGMYLGRCFMSDERTIGALWDEYKRHPKLMCSIQDDDFTAGYRREWNNGKPA
jgi:hypothetical protein